MRFRDGLPSEPKPSHVVNERLFDRMLQRLVVVVLLLSTLSVGYSRPHFKPRIPEFDGGSTADQDGVYRHDSTQITTKRNTVSSNNYLRYEAILIDGIVRVDEDLRIEKVLCQRNQAQETITVTTTSTELGWTNETILVGGAEWGCTQNSQGHAVPFTARILGQLPLSMDDQVTFLVEFIPMKDLFKHLDLEMRMEEQQISSQSSSSSTFKRSSESAVQPTTQGKHLTKRTNDPTILEPWDQDIFFSGEHLTVSWINIPGDTLSLEVYNSQGLYRAFDNLAVVASGEYQILIDGTWAVDYYQITLYYNCDAQQLCNYIVSDNIFAVGIYPDITFNLPERGHLYAVGDSIDVSVDVNDTFTGPFYLSIWELNSNSPIWNTSFTSYSFQASIPSNSSWVSSNYYVVSVDYDCDPWCYYQTSEFFSVVSTDSTTSLQFDQPFQGTSYQGGSYIPVTLVANFTVDTDVYVTLTPIGILTADWGCTADVCTGYAESEEFSVNYALELSFNPVAPEYVAGDIVYLSWSTAQHYTDMTVSICYTIPFMPDSCASLGTYDSGEGFVTWEVNLNQGSGIWDNYFYAEYNCRFGVLCDSIQSNFFRIRTEYEVLNWNYDPNTHQAAVSDYNFFHTDCATMQDIGGFCTSAANANSPACQLCSMDGFDTALDISCHDCYAKVGVTVNQMKVSISFYRVTEFKSNLTVNATSELNLSSGFTLDYHQQYSMPLVPGPFTIYGMTPISIAGFQFYFGVYGSISLVADFNIEGNVMADVSAIAGAVYDVYYDSNTTNFIASSRTTYFDVTSFDMSMQASASVRVAVVPQVQLSILSEQEAIYINAQPYILMTLSGALPPYSALPAGTVPQNSASVPLFADNCSTQHWLEVGVSSGVTWAGGYHWGSSSNEYTGTLIADFPIASGCLWPAQSAQGSSAVPIRFSPSAFSNYGLTTDSFQTAVVFDIADSLGIPQGAVSKVNLSTTSDANGLMAFDVYFSDTASLQAQSLCNQLLALMSDSSSVFYSPTRLVTKSASISQASQSPVSLASVTPSSSPLISPSSSSTSSPSASPLISPSHSPVAMSPSVSAAASVLPSSSPVAPSVSPSSSASSSSVASASSSPLSSAPLSSASPSASPDTNSNPPSSKSHRTAFIVIGAVVVAVVVGAIVGGVILFVRSRKSPTSFNRMHDEL